MFSLAADDNRASDLTKKGMLKGIEEAAAFVLFLSQGVLQRPYCQMEIRHALALKKPMVLLHGEPAGLESFNGLMWGVCMLMHRERCPVWRL